MPDRARRLHVGGTRDGVRERPVGGGPAVRGSTVGVRTSQLVPIEDEHGTLVHEHSAFVDPLSADELGGIELSEHNDQRHDDHDGPRPAELLEPGPTDDGPRPSAGGARRHSAAGVGRSSAPSRSVAARAADGNGAAAPVAIDARAAARAEIGGVERFAREMAARLPELRPDRYRVLRPPSAFAHRAGHLWEQAVLPRRARGSEVVYCPANLAPMIDRRAVVVIHDAAALRMPSAYSRGYVAYQRRVLPLIARRARLVITVSEFARAELIELLGVAPERITVIPGGVDERFGAAVDPAPARRAYGLEGPYALAVGTRSARKNFKALEPAARALRRHGIELVIAGSERGYLRDGASGLRSLGYVAESQLPALYAGACVLAMPSLHEGFGLPCLEAMASGVPVVAAHRGALPETVAEAGLLVDPGHTGDLADALVAGACDGELRARLIAAGLRRASRYTWQQTAILTDRAIEGVLSAHA
jgi:glycosyltransferase involved in cell wall biosynthesis